MDHVRLFVVVPRELVDRPMIYEVVKRFDVVPNIRRANVEPHSGWVILELGGSAGAARRRDRVPRRGRLHREHHGRRRHRGMTARDGATPSAPARAARGGERRHRRRASSASSRAGSSGRSRSSSTRGARLDARRARGGPSATRSTPAPTATARVVAELRELFALDPAAQTATPLEIVRSAYREPTAVLGGRRRSRRSSATSSTSGPGPTTATGWCRTRLGDLGDPDLAPLQWRGGMAKAAVLRAARELP